VDEILRAFVERALARERRRLRHHSKMLVFESLLKRGTERIALRGGGGRAQRLDLLFGRLSFRGDHRA
jgi:hypothetical protein